LARGRVHRHRWPRHRGRGRGAQVSDGRASGLALDLRAALARTYVRVVGSFREPSWMITDAVVPNLGMCAFVLLYRALGAPASFEALAVVGGMLSTYWLNVLWGMGTQL